MTTGVLAASAASRSWFSAAGPPIRVPEGSSERRRSIVAPSWGLEGSLVGTASISTWPPPPGWGGRDRAMPGSPCTALTAGWRAEAGATIWRAPGAPGPKPAWICS